MQKSQKFVVTRHVKSKKPIPGYYVFKKIKTNGLVLKQEQVTYDFDTIIINNICSDLLVIKNQICRNNLDAAVEHITKILEKSKQTPNYHLVLKNVFISMTRYILTFENLEYSNHSVETLSKLIYAQIMPTISEIVEGMAKISLSKINTF